MKIQPLHDRVVVKPDPPETKTAGGIIIPDNATEKPIYGTVIACGKGTSSDKMTLKNGQRIIFGRYAGVEFPFDGEKFLIMRETDVFAIV